jgi:hypothetical protein
MQTINVTVVAATVVIRCPTGLSWLLFRTCAARGVAASGAM